MGFGEYQATAILLSVRQEHSQAAPSSSFIRVRVMGLLCLVENGRKKTTTEWESSV